MVKKIVQGTLRTNPKGFGFVIVKNEDFKDVYIAKSEMKNAIDSDLVEVEIKQIHPKGPEGKIIKVLKRERKYLAGIIIQKVKQHYLAYVPILGNEWQVVVISDKKLRIGDRVILEPSKDLSEEKGELISKMIKNIGNIEDATQDIDAAIYEYDIRKNFPKDVIDQVKKIKISKNDLKNRVDLTNDFVITIDPIDAKDFDDAQSLTIDKNKHFHLGVHIADVAYFVKPTSPIDKEALLRGNSTYFPNKCIPMIPYELSDGLCSLMPNEIRLTISVFMEFDPKGELVKYEIARSYIKSKKRLSYEEAKEILDSKKSTPLKKLLDDMVSLCLLLKQKRFDRGSIDFSLSDSKLILDKKGIPIQIKTVEYDITHQLIEEFMLKANEIVAIDLSKKGKELIYRIHEEPSYENLKDFIDLTKSLGFTLPPKPTHKDIQNLFVKAKDSKYLQLLSIAFIRNLRLASYSSKNVGHFGLALEYYTHFTSPIRRYSDLVVQRALFDEEDKNVNYEEISKICSDKERTSFKAEHSVITLKRLRFLKRILQREPKRIFIATITKVKPFGIYFELDEYLVEGFLHVSELEDDYYEFIEDPVKLVGTHKNRVLSLGTKIRVKIKEIDLILLETTFVFLKNEKKIV